MKLLIDTNIILDIFLKREPFFSDSYAAVRIAAEQDIECFLSTSAITGIFYILRKSFQSAERAKQILNSLMQLVSFSDVLASDTMNALASDMPDFEDAVVNAVAVRLGAEYILTRNTKDYAKADVKAISPTAFIESDCNA